MGKKKKRPRDVYYARQAEGLHLWETMLPENRALYMALRAEHDDLYRVTRRLNDAQPLARPMAEGGWRAAPESVALLERAMAVVWPVIWRIEEMPHEIYPASVNPLPRREDAAAWLGGPSPWLPHFRPHNAFRAAA